MDKKKLKVLLFIVVALGLAGLATFLGYAVIQDQLKESADVSNETEPVVTVKVLITVNSLPIGAIISGDMLGFLYIPETFVPPSAVLMSDFDSIIGRQVIEATAIQKPLLWSQLSGGPSHTFSDLVPEGMRAITIGVDVISSISGFLQPNDRIDLIMTYTAGQKAKINRILIQNVLVLASGRQIEVNRQVAQGNPQSISNVTLLVSPKDAKRIMLARSTGQITASLRNPLDDDRVSEAVLAPWQLFSSQIKKRKVAQQEKPIQFIVGGAQ